MSRLCSIAKNALNPRVSRLDPAGALPSLRSFSTEGVEPQPQHDPFLQSPEGPVFGRVTNPAKNTLKTDIIHYLEGRNLSPADIKVEYNRAYNPVSMLLRFPSQSVYEAALKQPAKKGRLFSLSKINGSGWEYLPSYNGKTLFLQGIPQNALFEDIERFLAGCNFDPNFNVFSRNIGPDGVIRCALVQFATSTDAMSAFLMKNNRFCLNNPISMRILQ